MAWISSLESHIEIGVKNIDLKTLRTAVRDVDAIIVRSAIFISLYLARGRKLTIVSRHGVGCDNIDVDHLSARGIPVAIASGSMPSLLPSIRRFDAGNLTIVNQDTSVKRGCWADRNKFRALICMVQNCYFGFWSHRSKSRSAL